MVGLALKLTLLIWGQIMRIVYDAYISKLEEASP